MTLLVETVPLTALRRHPRNYRAHPDAQLTHIEQSLRANGQYRNIVIADDSTILAGHGVAQAAERLGWETVSVIRLPLGPDDPRAIKVLVGDNEMGGRAETDDALLADLLRLVANEDDLVGTGFTPEMMAKLVISLAPPDVVYTDKIESPIYEPSGDQPPVQSLADTRRRDELLAGIDAADVPQPVAAFLRTAAERWTRFDYAAVADYYAHAPADVQALMEASALVIIDYDAAVERGLVSLHESVNEVFADDHPDA